MEEEEEEEVKMSLLVEEVVEEVLGNLQQPTISLLYPGYLIAEAGVAVSVSQMIAGVTRGVAAQA
jgi:hypothetical protein